MRIVPELHRLPDMDGVKRQASEWIARLSADDVSHEDRESFESWRRAHPLHARTYQELSGTWRKLTEVGKLVRAVELGHALSASARRAIRELQAQSRSRRARLEKRHFMTAAAALLAIVALGVGYLSWDQQPGTLFQTAIGERAAIELPDGSSLELNSNSRARVEYSQKARVIRLERGEGFFNVQHDTNRPFWVVAGDSWIRAVGTAFDVYLRPAGVRVTVSDGTVKVAADAPAKSGSPSDGQLARKAVSVLAAGQQVDMVRGTSKVRSLEQDELTRAVAWRRGTLHFEDARLADIVEDLNRYTTLKITVEDAALQDLRLGGTFEANSHGAETFLTMLHDGFGLVVRRDGSGAHIEAAAAM